MIEKEVLKNVEDSIFNYNNEPAIETGFYELDTFLKGIKKSSFIVIAARPEIGKSALAINIMLNLSKHNKKCLYFSMEMSKETVVQRIIAQESEINTHLLIYHPECIEQKDRKKITQVIDSISKYNFIIDDTPEITVSKLREKVEVEKPEYVFIDYLQLIYTSNEKSRADGITQVLQELKQIAKENNCIFFIVSQLNRTVEHRTDKRPMLSNIEGQQAGEIVEIADVIMFIYRYAYYKNEDKYLISEEKRNSYNNRQDDVEIIIAKNKMGPIGSAKLIFKWSILKYLNLP